MTYDFAGKTAVVTGASRGIGAVIARTLAADGARVVLVARSAAPLQELAASLGNGAIAIEADLGAPDGWQRASAAVLAAVGEVDILVNNAGTSHPAPIGQLNPAGLDDTFMVNVRNLILLTDALSASLIRRRGCVVNVSSVAAFSSSAGQATYAASKGAINAFTRNASVDLGRSGVRVNAVAPGLIDDGMWTAIFERGVDREATMASMRPLLPLEGRWGSAQNIADCVAWLASEQAGYVTGQVIRVDGGLQV